MYKPRFNSYENLKQGWLACTNTQGIAERNAFLNDALASSSAMVSENISFSPQSAVLADGSGFVKDAQSQCPPLETLPNKNNPVDCLCERKPEFLIPRRGTKNYDETSHKATEPASCKSLVPQCPSALVTSKKAAFTLAEVLITLAIIGVVAVLTIPGLVKNHNEKAWSTAQSVFEKRLEVAAKQLNTEEKLAGYSSTMDFVNELKNKIKIINVCDSNNLSKCFENKILTADGQEVDAANLKTSAQLAKENWGTETVGVQFANGVNALIAYNPNTDQQPFNNQFSATEASMAILYDVSGYKNPNTLGKDINMNANVADFGCQINPDLLGGICITKILAPDTGYSPMTRAECEAQKGDLGISECYYDEDYWAGAVKACGGKSNLPTMEQLGQLAGYLYDTDSIRAQQYYNGPLNTTKAAQFLSASPNSDKFYVWSVQECGPYDANARDFRSTGTSWYNYFRHSDLLAVCLSN